jgi:hypothetical protein
MFSFAICHDKYVNSLIYLFLLQFLLLARLMQSHRYHRNIPESQFKEL